MKKRSSIIIVSLIVVLFVTISTAVADSVSIGQYNNSLTQAVSSIGSDKKTLYIDYPTPSTLEANTVVPANISIIMEYPGSINNSYTLTINGSFSAGPYKVFTGSGTVTALAPLTAYPEWFGAGASQTTAVNDVAISRVLAMIAAGSTIVFKEVYPNNGDTIYNVNVPCTIDGNHIGGIRRTYDGGQNSNFRINADRVTIRNMKFEASHTGTVYLYSAIDIRGDYCTVEGCSFMGATGPGLGKVLQHISLNPGATEAHISHNRFYDATAMIEIYGNVTNSIIEGNYFTGTGNGVSTSMVSSLGNDNITIRDNNFISCGRGVMAGFGGLAHGRIINNYFHSVGRGIWLDTEYYSNPAATSVYETAQNRFITISNNTFDCNLNDIIFTSGFYDGITSDEAWATRFIVVEGNQFLNTNATGNSVIGGGANNIIFSDNLFFNSKGLLYSGGGNNIKFTNNIVYSTETVVEMFRLNNNSKRIFFTDNYFYGSNYAVFVTGSLTDFNMSNNYFGMSNPSGGIMSTGGDLNGIHINNNTFERTSGAGSSVINIAQDATSASNMSINNNTVRNFGNLLNGNSNTSLDNIILSENILENTSNLMAGIPANIPTLIVRNNIPPTGAGVSADVGNNDFTYSAQTSAHTIIYDTPVTANRIVTLSNSAAANGYRVRVVRTTNCTVPYNINVGTGPLKAMGTPGTWADFEYNGTAWILTGYGTL